MGKFLVDLIALGRHDRAHGLAPIYLGVRMTGGTDVVSSV
jgi:hypothetical protein